MPCYHPDELLDQIESLRARMYRIVEGDEEEGDAETLLLLSRQLDDLIHRFMRGMEPGAAARDPGESLHE